MAAGRKKKTDAPKKERKQLSDTQRWVMGIVILAFAVFLLVAVISYYFCWSADQSFVRFSDLDGDGSVANPTGKLGAVMANYVVGEWFGIFGLAIPVMLIIIALRVINYRPAILSKSVRIALIVMILGSISLGYLFGIRWNAFGTGLGGSHGIYLSGLVVEYIGKAGTGLLLLLGWILLGVYINRRTIRVVNNVGKGIYDGGRKMGGAVLNHASDLMSRGDGEDGEPDVEPDAGELYADGVDENMESGGYAQPAETGRPGMEYYEDSRPEYGESGGQQDGYRDMEIVRPTERTEESVVLGRDESVGQEGPGGYGIRDNSRVVEQKQGVFTVVSTEKEEPKAPRPVPEGASNVVMLGEDAGNFIVGSTGAEAARVTDQSRYAGGIGRYADDPREDQSTSDRLVSGHYSAEYPAAGRQPHGGEYGGMRVESRDGTVGIREEYRSEPGDQSGERRKEEERGSEGRDARSGMFEVVDRGGSTPLSAGGVVESASGDGGVKPDDRMRVVVSGKADAILNDDDIDASLYDPTKELSKYQKPPVELLEDHSIDVQVTEEEIYDNKNQIVNTLRNFGISIDKIKATIGPTVTLYEIIPSAGVKISKIKNLEDDIALSLKALGIRIIAPMPGKGTVGIEVPNKDKEIVSMYSVVKTMKFQESKYELPIVLGKTISNETFMIDLAKMPHLLVAGSTGQGKSVGLNAIITSLLYKKHPAELKFVLVDPKRVELSLYSKLEKHFLAKMQSEDEAILTDTQRVVYTLNALCMEMSERYDLLRMAEVKKISEYNEKFLKRRLNPAKGHRFMPYIVVVVDEFADMIMTAGREVETPITRLAQLARAVGIHLVIATQRPDVKVITGLIKANFPARIAFRVMSMVDSRTIIDQPGANQLIGRGDMLMSLNGELTRVQCAFIDTPEIERITEFIGNQRGYAGAYDLPDYSPEGDAGGERNTDLGPLDPMFEDVARFVVQNQQGSTSSIQRRFSIGYNRAGRIMDQLEDAGVVGRAEGSKPREVLIMDANSLEYILGNLER